MDDEVWRRHANPWSVYTRFVAIPAGILAVWSRTWIGWWSLVPVTLVLLWLWINPWIFPPVGPSSSRTAKGIYGEKLWLSKRHLVPARERRVLALLIGAGMVGLGLTAWGLIVLWVWPTVVGAIVVTIAQLWRIARMAVLYDQLAPGESTAAGAR